MKRILITGKDGQVGWELQRTLATHGKVIALDRSSLDLAHPDKIRQAINEIRPDLIVNTAAYTAVDKAETDHEMSLAINGKAPAILAEEAKRHGAILIHFSTDYVFDGTSKQPYLETDLPNPLNAYGQTKLIGEKAIQSIGGSHLILRTSWIYGARGKNFLLTIQRLAKERDLLKIVGDQFGTPTWSRMLAEATAQIVAKVLHGKNEQHLWGLYHLTSSGQTSWYDFAKAILELYQRRFPAFNIPQLQKISTAEYPLPAKRPLFSALSNEKIFNSFGVQMPAWHEALELCIDEQHQYAK